MNSFGALDQFGVIFVRVTEDLSTRRDRGDQLTALFKHFVRILLFLLTYLTRRQRISINCIVQTFCQDFVVSSDLSYQATEEIN